MSSGPTVIIAGMHRSGTSAMAGALAKLGMEVGTDSEMLVPTEDNPAGYFENRRIIECNEAILQQSFLQAHGKTSLNKFFTEPSTLDEYGWLFGAWSSPVLQGHESVSTSLAQIVNQIEGRSAQTAFLLKDPRMSLLLPIWLERLRRPIVVIMLRHPDEVAMSLWRRDHLPVSLGYSLWMMYNVAVFAGSRETPRIVVDYGQLMEQPNEEMRRVIDFLSQHGCSSDEDAPQTAASTLLPELRRQRSRMDGVPANVAEYYHAARKGNPPEGVSVSADWSCALVVPLLRKLEHTAGVLKHQLQHKQADLEATHIQLQDALDRLQQLNQRFLDAQHELVRMNQHPIVGRCIRLLRWIKQDPSFGKPFT